MGRVLWSSTGKEEALCFAKQASKPWVLTTTMATSKPVAVGHEAWVGHQEMVLQEWKAPGSGALEQLG